MKKGFLFVLCLLEVYEMRSKEDCGLFSVRMLIHFGSESAKRTTAITTVRPVCSRSVLSELNSQL
jgi:hypothetical protein